MADPPGSPPYAFWFRPSTGVHDPIRARALVLTSGATQILWLAVDTVGIDPTLVTDLRQRLAARGSAPTLVLSASHTHSGPGAYSESSLFGFLALDRLAPEVRARLLDGLEAAAGAGAGGAGSSGRARRWARGAARWGGSSAGEAARGSRVR